MNARNSLRRNVDWVMLLLYAALVFAGWANIYAATYNLADFDITDLSQSYVKQILWVTIALVLGFSILLIDSKFYTAFAYVIYASMILLLIFVLFFGKEVNGARSWFQLGGFRLQPAEFAKFATALAVARFLSSFGMQITRLSNLIKVALILALPALLIIKQNDTGSALVYSSFSLVLYREGMSGNILLVGVSLIILFIAVLLSNMLFVLIGVLILGMVVFFILNRNLRNTLIAGGTIAILSAIAYYTFVLLGKEVNLEHVVFASTVVTSVYFVVWAFRKRLTYVYIILLYVFASVAFSFSVDYFYNKILSPHQQTRIDVLLGIKNDPKGVGYNVEQSKIAIGSGGLYGKGFLQGTQNKGSFVPEQSTDFIFCTVGEEWGFVGSVGVLVLFVAFLWRLIWLAEKQRSIFSRIYGYSVVSIIFFHLIINVGMTIGLTPIIGIPLPFFSYGGSSLLSFTVLLFIFIRLDASRSEII